MFQKPIEGSGRWIITFGLSPDGKDQSPGKDNAHQCHIQYAGRHGGLGKGGYGEVYPIAPASNTFFKVMIPQRKLWEQY
ncbi:hypothetical protein [Echinicola shivajiensis]|uniref:hypothetical protein n=1 Tax=Echinicola shivajiensis TaxID=1035916 RepID=UPI001BFCA829|nr:hypothetical protein [Echinicola shivajiensis]